MPLSCYRSIDLQIKDFANFDFNGDRDGWKFTLGYMFTLASVVVSCTSKLQQVVALSTPEAKYVVEIEASKEAIWVEWLINDFKMMQGKITLHCDSEYAINWMSNPTFHDCMKDIDISTISQA